MDITLNRAELLTAAKRAANIAPADCPVDVLQGVLLEAEDKSLSLSATNMETALEQKIPCESKDLDALVVNANLFMQMLERLGGETVELRRNGPGKSLTIKSGEATFHIRVWERGSFPKMEIPFPEDTVQITGIPNMAKRTVFAVGQNSDQPLLKCVNLMFTKDGLKAVGSDGNCVVSAKGDDKSTGNINLLIPAHSLHRLARMCDDKSEFRVGTTGQTIVFFRENFAYSAHLMEGSYIDSDQLIGSLNHSFTVLTDVLDLRNALRSATAIDQSGAVKMTFKGSKLIFSTSGEDGAGSASLEIIPLTGAPQSVYNYATRQLLGCLASLTGTVTLGIAQGGMLTLSTQDAFYMQVGLRATTAKTKKSVKKATNPPTKKAA